MAKKIKNKNKSKGKKLKKKIVGVMDCGCKEGRCICMSRPY